MTIYFFSRSHATPSQNTFFPSLFFFYSRREIVSLRQSPLSPYNYFPSVFPHIPFCTDFGWPPGYQNVARINRYKTIALRLWLILQVILFAPHRLWDVSKVTYTSYCLKLACFRFLSLFREREQSKNITLNRNHRSEIQYSQ